MNKTTMKTTAVPSDAPKKVAAEAPRKTSVPAPTAMTTSTTPTATLPTVTLPSVTPSNVAVPASTTPTVTLPSVAPTTQPPDPTETEVGRELLRRLREERDVKLQAFSEAERAAEQKATAAVQRAMENREVGLPGGFPTAPFWQSLEGTVIHEPQPAELVCLRPPQLLSQLHGGDRNDSLLLGVMELVVRRPDWKARGNDKRHVMWLMGATETGQTAGVELTGVRPSFLAILPGMGDDDDPAERLVAETLRGRGKASTSAPEWTQEQCNTLCLSLNRSLSGRSKFTRQVVLRIEVEWRTPLIGFTAMRRDAVLRVTVADLNDLKAVVAELKEQYRMEVAHDQWSLVTQYLQQTIPRRCEARLNEPLETGKGVRFCRWVRLPRSYLQEVQGPRRTTCQWEGRIDGRQVQRAEGLEKMVPILAMAWDIECISQEGYERGVDKFPDAERVRDVITHLSLVPMVVQYSRLPFLRILLTLKRCAPLPNVLIYSFDTEGALLAAFREICVARCDADLPGYNTAKFDLPYCFKRNSLSHVPSFTQWSRFTNMPCSLYERNGEIQTPGRWQLDFLPVIIQSKKLPSYSLKSVCAEMIKAGLNKLDLPYTAIAPLYHEGGLDGRAYVGAYCVQDSLCVCALDIDNLLTPNALEISTLCNLPVGDVVLRGQQVRVYGCLTEAIDHGDWYENRSIMEQPCYREKVPEDWDGFTQGQPIHELLAQRRDEGLIEPEGGYHKGDPRAARRDRLWQMVLERNFRAGRPDYRHDLTRAQRAAMDEFFDRIMYPPRKTVNKKKKKMRRKRKGMGGGDAKKTSAPTTTVPNTEGTASATTTTSAADPRGQRTLLACWTNRPSMTPATNPTTTATNPAKTASAKVAASATRKVKSLRPRRDDDDSSHDDDDDDDDGDDHEDSDKEDECEEDAGAVGEATAGLSAPQTVVYRPGQAVGGGKVGPASMASSRSVDEEDLATRATNEWEELLRKHTEVESERCHHEERNVHLPLGHPDRGRRWRPGDETLAIDASGGGCVFRTLQGIYHLYVSILDFASLYPSIIMAENIDYSTLVWQKRYLHLPGVQYRRAAHSGYFYYFAVVKPHADQPARFRTCLPDILRTMVAKRRSVKAEEEACQDPFHRAVLKAAQTALKIVCNASYGFVDTPEEMAKLPCPPLAYLVTSTGRDMIRLTKSFVEVEAGGIVVYGDTDSVMVAFPDAPFEPVVGDPAETKRRERDAHDRQCDIVCRRASEVFQHPHELENENTMSHALMVKKKCYAYQNAKDGKLTVKGLANVRRNYGQGLRQLCRQVQVLLLSEQLPQIRELVVGYVERLAQYQVPLADLSISAAFVEGSERSLLVRPYTLQKVAMRLGMTFQGSERIQFVMIRKANVHTKAHEQGEELHYAEREHLLPDVMHYLKELEHPLEVMLQYNFDFRTLLATLRQRAQTLQHAANRPQAEQCVSRLFGRSSGLVAAV